MKKESNTPEMQMSQSASKRRPAVTIVMTFLLLVVLPAAYFFFSGNNPFNNKEAKTERQATLVTVAKSTVMDMPVRIKAIAHVEPMQTVAVRTRVDGEVTQVLFKEGDYVQQGTPLFQIDSRPFLDKVKQSQAALVQGDADVKQAEAELATGVADLRRQQANLESDQAKETYARNQWSRYSDLVKQGAVSRDQEEQVRSNASSLVAMLKGDRASLDNQKAVIQAHQAKIGSAKARLSSLKVSLDNAKLELSYCLVRSPIEGRTGKLQVHQGDMVKQHSDTPLVVINQVKPIYVTFSIPEKELQEVVAQNARQILSVDILTASDSKPIKGELSFLDNTVEPTTGMISLKAKVPNLDGGLWPGQYVTAFLYLRTIKNAVVVPTQAIQIGQKGQYIFVVKPDMTADLRYVKIDHHHGGKTVIAEGLQAGETVVLDGQMQLVPGSKVTIAKDPAEQAQVDKESR